MEGGGGGKGGQKEAFFCLIIGVIVAGVDFVGQKTDLHGLLEQ